MILVGENGGSSVKPTYRPASRPGAHRWCGFAGLVLEKAGLQDRSDWARDSEVCIATHSPHVAMVQYVADQGIKKEQNKEMDLDRVSLFSRDGPDVQRRKPWPAEHGCVGDNPQESWPAQSRRARLPISPTAFPPLIGPGVSVELALHAGCSSGVRQRR